MPRLAAAAVLATLLLPVAPARAAVTDAFVTHPCWHNQGLLYSGPVTIADEDAPGTVHTGTVTCSIQEGGTGAHSEPDAVSVTGPAGAGVAAVPPTPVAWTPPEDVWRYWWCTRLDLSDGTTLYLHDPPDRNDADYWSGSPAARCHQSWQTSDLRWEDTPGPEALAAADLALGAACTVVACDPEVTYSASVTVVREPAGAFVGTVPASWACTDTGTGLPVTAGSALALPDPGVSCATAAPVTCYRVQVAGALAPTALGRIDVTSACGTLDVTQRLSALTGLAKGWWHDYGSGHDGPPPPFTCRVAEDVTGGAASYVASCGAGF